MASPRASVEGEESGRTEIQAPWGLIALRRKPFHGLATGNANSHSGIKSRRFSGVMTTESGCRPSGRSRPM